MLKTTLIETSFNTLKVMDLFLKRKLSMLTLNLQIKFRNGHRPKILTVNVIMISDQGPLQRVKTRNS